MEQISKIPATIEVNVYYYINEETNQPVFDTDEMEKEFQEKLKQLEIKTL